MLSRIEIVGNIASGKSTFLKKYSNKYYLVYESYESNPFLISFYKDPSFYSFETEISFLLLHYHSIKNQLRGDKSFICDFSIILDKAFAEVTLPPERKTIFFQIADEIENEIGIANKIFFLNPPLNVLQSRIKNRGREFEQNIPADYLSNINEAIKTQIHEYKNKTEIVEVEN